MESGKIYNLNGVVVKQFSFKDFVSIPTNCFNPNVYIVRVGNQIRRILIL